MQVISGFRPLSGAPTCYMWANTRAQLVWNVPFLGAQTAGKWLLQPQGPFNCPPRIALGRAAPTSLAGCRESECEKVSQAEEKEKKKASSPQAKYLFSSCRSLSFL